jgi:hypothetical protein
MSYAVICTNLVGSLKFSKQMQLFEREVNGVYRCDDGGVLDAAILAVVLSGDGSTHGCSVERAAEFASSGGDFGGNT